MNAKILSLTLIFTTLSHALLSKNSLSPLQAGKFAQNVQELWAGYDPRTEPLNVKVIRDWDEVYEGKQIKVQMLTFTVGTFKNQVSRISAYYAYPKGVKDKVPGLVQVHGGGQRANKHMVEVDAANGYASISLNWGGRELEDQKPGEPGTNWGAIDPTQKHVSHYFRLTPDEKTVESVYSPRNNNWFILSLATRRGLTFLEQQPQVGSRKARSLRALHGGNHYRAGGRARPAHQGFGSLLRGTGNHPGRKYCPPRSILRPTSGRQTVLPNHRFIRIPPKFKIPNPWPNPAK
jgi:hypothetical protein